MKVESIADLRGIIYNELVDAYNTAVVDDRVTVVSFAYDPETKDLLVGDEENDTLVTNAYNYVVAEVDARWDHTSLVTMPAYIADDLLEIYE